MEEKKVKEEYISPEMEIIEFETEDVITDSAGGLEGGDDVEDD